MTDQLKGQRFSARLDALKPNPYQRRKKFNNVQELADGIKGNGFFGAILVCAIPDDPSSYYIIAGERRVRACRLLNMVEIPADLLELSDEQMQRVCAIENLQREDLTPIEEADTYNDMLKRCGSIEQVAAETGKSRVTVEKRLALLRLVPDVQLMVDDGKLSLQQAECLLEIEDPAQQLQTAQIAIRGNMDVNRLKNLVQQHTGKSKKKEGGEGGGERRVTSKAVSAKVIDLSDLLDGLDIGALKADEIVTLISQFEVLGQSLQEKKEALEQRSARVAPTAVAA